MRPAITSYDEAQDYYEDNIKYQSGMYKGCTLENNTRLVRRERQDSQSASAEAQSCVAAKLEQPR
jgi:hypothetical protein